ncbi:putative LigA [Burkholderia cenocepacia]|nr:putative LigA [Burkholderia cenocepacia]
MQRPRHAAPQSGPEMAPDAHGDRRADAEAGVDPRERRAAREEGRPARLRDLQRARRGERAHRRTVPGRSSGVHAGAGAAGAGRPAHRARDGRLPVAVAAPSRDRRLLRRGARAPRRAVTTARTDDGEFAEPPAVAPAGIGDSRFPPAGDDLAGGDPHRCAVFRVGGRALRARPDRCAAPGGRACARRGRAKPETRVVSAVRQRVRRRRATRVRSVHVDVAAVARARAAVRHRADLRAVLLRAARVRARRPHARVAVDRREDRVDRRVGRDGDDRARYPARRAGLARQRAVPGRDRAPHAAVGDLRRAVGVRDADGRDVARLGARGSPVAREHARREPEGRAVAGRPRAARVRGDPDRAVAGRHRRDGARRVRRRGGRRPRVRAAEDRQQLRVGLHHPARPLAAARRCDQRRRAAGRRHADPHALHGRARPRRQRDADSEREADHRRRAEPVVIPDARLRESRGAGRVHERRRAGTRVARRRREGRAARAGRAGSDAVPRGVRRGRDRSGAGLLDRGFGERHVGRAIEREPQHLAAVQRTRDLDSVSAARGARGRAAGRLSRGGGRGGRARSGACQWCAGRARTGGVAATGGQSYRFRGRNRIAALSQSAHGPRGLRQGKKIFIFYKDLERLK